MSHREVYSIQSGYSQHRLYPLGDPALLEVQQLPNHNQSFFFFLNQNSLSSNILNLSWSVELTSSPLGPSKPWRPRIPSTPWEKRFNQRHIWTVSFQSHQWIRGKNSKEQRSEIWSNGLQELQAGQWVLGRHWNQVDPVDRGVFIRKWNSTNIYVVITSIKTLL